MPQEMPETNNHESNCAEPIGLMFSDVDEAKYIRYQPPKKQPLHMSTRLAATNTKEMFASVLETQADQKKAQVRNSGEEVKKLQEEQLQMKATIEK